MDTLEDVYNFIMKNLSHYGVLPMYIHNLSDEKELIHVFDFPCHREFHRISYYPQLARFKYFKLPIDFLHKEDLLKTQQVPYSRLILETSDILEIQHIFKESAKLEFNVPN